MPVRWVRLSDVGIKLADAYMCCRCGEMEQFEDAWTVIPFAENGRQMMQGYIHCHLCHWTDPVRAWREAHAKESGHAQAPKGGHRED